MNLIEKAVKRFRRVELPNVNMVQTMSGKRAYLCLDPACQALMERAPRGKCESCGQSCIVPVQGLVHVARRFARARKQLEKETPDKEQARRAMRENQAAYLTDFRAV